MSGSDRRPLLATGALVALFTAGCPGLGDETAPILDRIPERPTYEEHLHLVFDFYCTLCHSEPAANGAPSTFRLDRWDPSDDVAGVEQKIGSIETVVLAKRLMPPFGQPPLAFIDRKSLARWIAAGAPRR